MEGFLIDELARRAGMTVRNVRNYQTRGLLPGPEVRGRTGYYDEDHLARLDLIKELQKDGLSLQLIEQLVAGSKADGADRLIALRRQVLSSMQPGEPEILTLDDLVRRFGEFDEESMQRAFGLGAIVPRVDGTFAAPFPEVLQTAEEVVSQGFTLKAALRVAEIVQRNAKDIADAFVELVFEELWLPFDEAGRPEGKWPDVAEAVDRVRPLGGEIVLAMLMPALTESIERVFGDVLKEQASAAGGS